MTKKNSPFSARFALRSDQGLLFIVYCTVGESRIVAMLRKNGLSVVAIHNHMTGTNPTVYFLHYWGKGPTVTLAAGFRAALDQIGKGASQASAKR